ncbi:glycosyl transferase family 1 [Massilia sp. KIM]|uniref:glycosyltransferase family 4 protein n=1 Tax=Massilia sp. KIM TaxID=1955422 RepID=UPI00098FC0B9|nr:glycosyltransferase family 1 protein [Massilia sp. KIM]OON62554.1 glycosyl transferase family 1 [Massilia sp. KIM]
MLSIALISEHASPLAPPGGIDSGGQNVYVAHLARQLAALGHRVDVFTRRDAPERPPCENLGDGVRVVHVPAGPPCFVPKEKLLTYMDDFARHTIAFMRAQDLAHDLVHANFFMSGVVAQHVKGALGIPFVITFHALGLVRRREQGTADGFPALRPAIERSLMREAERIVAECPQDREDMLSLYEAEAERIEIVPCGFDPDELWPVRAAARRRLGLRDDEFAVLQLGRIVPRKGIDNVISGVAALRDAYGLRARLLVAGGPPRFDDGPEAAELARLRALTAELGLREQVIFTGPVPRAELREFYSAADVFVTTPWYEPFGITPLEAMACATPVVGADVGGIRSTVVDGRTGYLVPPRAPGALAERLADLARHPRRARRLGLAGLRRVHDGYTWRSVAERMCGVYARAVWRADAQGLPGQGQGLPSGGALSKQH